MNAPVWGVIKMIDFTTSNNIRFHYRVAGVAIQADHVLLHQSNEETYWILPGGRVEAGETSSQALRREMREELGQDVDVGRLLWIVESFLRFDGRRVHGLGLYYQLTLSAPLDPFEVMDGQTRLSFAWHPLSRLSDLTVYPPFLSTQLLALPEHPVHILDIRTESAP
jgi:8-oxo-dGTP pyrophosphatase MutT (NUDIX family)